jgi:hypothetical protein
MILIVVEETYGSHTDMVSFFLMASLHFEWWIEVNEEDERRSHHLSPWVGPVPRGYGGLANVFKETELNREDLPSPGRPCLPPFSKLLSSSFLSRTASMTRYRSHSHQVITVKTVRGIDTTAKIQTW